MGSVDIGAQNKAAWLDVLQQLMPRGIAWNDEISSIQTKLLMPLANALATTDAECEAVAIEMEIKNALLLLPDYETYLGLPECDNLSLTTLERRKNIITKDKLNGGLATWQIESLAKELGFDIKVEEIWPHHCLRSCIAPINQQYWRHTLKVTVLSVAVNRFTCIDSILSPLINNDARALECLLNKYKMAGKYYDFHYIASN